MISVLTVALLTMAPQPADSPALIAAYRQAIAHMGPAPKYLTFHEAIVSDDVDVRVFRDRDGIAHTGIVTGRANGGRAGVDVHYRGEDELASLTFQDGGAGLSHSPFYDPTWSGMRAWLRYGLQGVPAGAPVITPQSEVTAASQALISVKAFTVAFYQLEDKGAAKCPDGSPGRAIHLTAYRDLDEHPLSDVVLDNDSERFCSMRFHLYVPGPVLFRGYVELHFAPVDSYYLATAGSVEGDIEMVGEDVEPKHALIRFSRSNFSFPADISAATFEPRVASSP